MQKTKKVLLLSVGVFILLLKAYTYWRRTKGSNTNTAVDPSAMHPILKQLKIRSDAQGDGEFNASRIGRKHQGVDFSCTAGELVSSPIAGKVKRITRAYSDDPNYLNVVIENGSYLVKLMYVSPLVTVGKSVATGDVIGKAQSIKKKYGGGMTDHIHFEVWVNGKAVDPMRFF